MKLRKVQKNNKYLTVEIQDKRVKNINYRISEEKIKVSKPFNVSAGAVLNLIEERFDWFYNKQKSLLKRKETEQRLWNDRDIYLFGKEYQIKKTNTREIVIGSDCLMIPFKHDQKMIEEFLRELLLNYLNENRHNFDRILNNRGIKLPKIKVRKMKSRWGSCLIDQGIIHINLRLIHYRPEVINYVLLHEYLHFIVPNHSEDFYDLMSRYLPNYKEINKELNH